MVCFFKLGVKLDEINAQPKVFRRSFYHNLLKKNAPDDFSLDLYLLLVAKKRGIKFKIYLFHFTKDYLVLQKVAAV